MSIVHLTFQQPRKKNSYVTVKASNFEPQENVGLLFRRASYHQNESSKKMKGIKVVEKRSICKLCSVHFFVQDSPKEATDLAKIDSKVPWSAEFEIFTVFFN
jgi:hypothetical protein